MPGTCLRVSALMPLLKGNYGKLAYVDDSCDCAPKFRDSRRIFMELRGQEESKQDICGVENINSVVVLLSCLRFLFGDPFCKLYLRLWTEVNHD